MYLKFSKIKNRVMELLFIWLLFGLLTSIISRNKGYSGVGGFIVGVLLGPLGLIIELITPKRQNTLNKRSGNTQKCPHCAEYIKEDAVVCRYCGNSLESQSGFNIEDFRR